MIPIISIVGRTNSGKTTLIERLIPEFTKRGIRIGTIKHDAHDNFEMDHEGKDTWRHKQAGAATVLISSVTKLGMVASLARNYSLEQLADKFFDDVHLILVEGYKRLDYPKIEVVKDEPEPELLCTVNDNLIALVSEQEIDRNVPVFKLTECEKLAKLIIEKFLN